MNRDIRTLFATKGTEITEKSKDRKINREYSFVMELNPAVIPQRSL